MTEIAAKRPFLGWRVLAAAFTSQFVATTLAFSAFGVFVTELEAEFGVDRATLSGGYGAAFLVSGLLGPLAGRIADRRIRLALIGGLLLSGAGLVLASRAESLWQLGLAYGLMVIVGAVFSGPIASMTLVGRWFVRRRGLCAAIAVAGATLSSAVGPLGAAWLIENYDWRVAALGLAAAGVAIGLPIFALFAHPSPEAVGQHPDGDDQAPPPEPDGGEALPTSALLRDRNFFAIALSMGLLYTSPIVFGLHFVPFAESLGFAKTEASFIFTVLAATSLTAKVLFGAIIDRIDPRLPVVSMSILLVGGWALLLGEPSYSRLVSAGLVFGLGIGAAAPIQAVLVGRCFGRAGFGHVTGMTGLVSLPLIAGANPIAGALYVATGGYRAGFLLEMALLALAGVLILFLRVPAASSLDAEEPIPTAATQ